MVCMELHIEYVVNLNRNLNELSANTCPDRAADVIREIQDCRAQILDREQRRLVFLPELAQKLKTLKQELKHLSQNKKRKK